MHCNHESTLELKLLQRTLLAVRSFAAWLAQADTSVKVWCKLLKLASLLAVDGSKREKTPDIAD